MPKKRSINLTPVFRNNVLRTYMYVLCNADSYLYIYCLLAIGIMARAIPWQMSLNACALARRPRSCRSAWACACCACLCSTAGRARSWVGCGGMCGHVSRRIEEGRELCAQVEGPRVSYARCGRDVVEQEEDYGRPHRRSRVRSTRLSRLSNDQFQVCW